MSRGEHTKLLILRNHSKKRHLCSSLTQCVLMSMLGVTSQLERLICCFRTCCANSVSLLLRKTQVKITLTFLILTTFITVECKIAFFVCSKSCCASKVHFDAEQSSKLGEHDMSEIRAKYAWV